VGPPVRALRKAGTGQHARADHAGIGVRRRKGGERAYGAAIGQAHVVVDDQEIVQRSAIEPPPRAVVVPQRVAAVATAGDDLHATVPAGALAQPQLRVVWRSVVDDHDVEVHAALRQQVFDTEKGLLPVEIVENDGADGPTGLFHHLHHRWCALGALCRESVFGT
jgi:hypothetical protein